MKNEHPLLDKAVDSWRKNRVPFSGSFELTPRCTLDCKMCYVHLNKDQMREGQELSGDEWIRIIDEAYDCGLYAALLTGGECMLHPDFKKIYLHLAEKAIQISLNTNATLLTDEWIAFFKKYPPVKVQISLYGNTEDGYERVTGYRVCERVKSNLLKLKETGIRVQVAITSSKYIYDEILDIMQFCQENQIHSHLTTNLREANDETERKIEDFGLSIQEDIDLWKKVYDFGGIKKAVPPERQLDSSIIPPLQEGKKPGLKCGGGRSSFALCWNGMMQTCLSYRVEQVDVRKLGFKKAWESIVKVADDYPNPIECFGCKLLGICDTCAMTRNDPNNPGHRNAAVCEQTIAKYNAGIISFRKSKEKT